MPSPRRDRRALIAALLTCAAGAGLVLWGASHTWFVEVTAQAAPLPPRTVARSGAALAPALPALGLVGLAGSAALAAVRGAARVSVGVLLSLCGLGVLVAVGVAMAGSPGVARAGPLACASGAAAVVVVGVAVVRRGRHWPALGARYDRASTRRRLGGHATGPGSRRDSAGTEDAYPDTAAARAPEALSMWHAIDRGEDPTEARTPPGP